jgi:hypothetical protein
MTKADFIRALVAAVEALPDDLPLFTAICPACESVDVAEVVDDEGGAP